MTKTTLRERFEKKFPWENCCPSCVDDKNTGYGDDIDSCCCTHSKRFPNYKIPTWLFEEIISFIESEIAQAREETREEIARHLDDMVGECRENDILRSVPAYESGLQAFRNKIEGYAFSLVKSRIRSKSDNK